MNILAHINASTQGNLSPPSVIPKHFVRILFKYASFPKLYCALSWFRTRNSALHLQEIPN
jgi:hypothetical protein